MEIYFDNAATTCCSNGVTEIIKRVLLEDYGNPSSLHAKGMAAENHIKKAKEQISKTLKVNEKEIIFTSGGTEADNLAIIGAAMANRRQGNHLITTKIEHPAVANAMRFLAEQGFIVTWLGVDEAGQISLDELRAAVTAETILVSMMHVNNETGAVEPIEAAAAIIKEKNSRTLLHVDAIQSYGKYKIAPKKMGIDLLSVSGHKIHGPKGTGFLYIKDKTKLKPLMFGGGQQGGIRSGTENVPGIAGLGQAAMEAYTDLEQRCAHLDELHEAFVHGISGFSWAHINGNRNQNSAPHIVNVSFDRIKSEVLLHALESKGIYVSSGSACASNKPAASPVLTSMGIKKEWLDASIRFSFSQYNTIEEVSFCIKTLSELVPQLQRYTRH